MTDAVHSFHKGPADSMRPREARIDKGGSESASLSRECGDCTACCSGVLRLEVNGQAVRPGHGCRHCRPAGCAIYDVRPVICRDFVCGWLRNDSALPPWMRPDRSGLILLPAYRRWRGVPVDVAIAASGGARPNALRWLKRFSETHRRPLLYQIDVDGEWRAIGPPVFQAELGRFLRHGGSLFK